MENSNRIQISTRINECETSLGVNDHYGAANGGKACQQTAQRQSQRIPVLERNNPRRQGMSASNSLPSTRESTPEEERQEVRILQRKHWQFKMALLAEIGFPYEIDDDHAFMRIRQFLQNQQSRIAELEAEIET